MLLHEGHTSLATMAVAFFLGVLVSRGTDILKTKVTTAFGHLVAAWFVGFVLAHLATRYMSQQDGFTRFPSPLIGPTPLGVKVPYGARGRDYIPHRPYPTAPPGPPVPAAHDYDTWGDQITWETSAPVAPPKLTLKGPAAERVPRPVNSILPNKTRAPWTPSTPTVASQGVPALDKNWALPYGMVEEDDDDS